MSIDAASVAKEIRKAVLRMHRRGSGVASAMSAADILAVLYFDVMNVPSPADPERDRFILSKGHAAAALYAALALKGFIPRELLDSFLADGSPLTAHPPAGLPGVDVPTGSLGHGLPIAAGMALAAARSARRFRVFVLLGCGEMQEGSVWEGAALASRLRLDNVVAIVDANALQGYDRTDHVQPVNTLAARLEAFGWRTREVDGHDCDAISLALRSAPFESGRPSAVIARTVKGKGVAEMEDRLAWHYFNVPEERLDAFLGEVDRGA
jgi:transketolase